MGRLKTLQGEAHEEGIEMEAGIQFSEETKQKIVAVLDNLRDQEFRLIQEAFRELEVLYLEGVSDEQARAETQQRFYLECEGYKQQIQDVVLVYYNVLMRQMAIEDFHFLRDMYRSVLLLFKQANRGHHHEQTHLKAISKIIFSAQYGLSPKDIREFAERDYSDGKIDRAIEILSLEDSLFYLVEPRQGSNGGDVRNPRVKIKLKDTPSIMSAFDELVQKGYLKIDFEALREEANVYLEDQSTLRSLAIKIYQQRLYNEGIDLHVETLERNVREFEKLKKDGRINYLMTRRWLPNGTFVLEMSPNNAWKSRAKEKHSISK